MKVAMSKSTIKLLRKEAKKVWEGFPLGLQKEISENNVYKVMKNSWKEGNKLPSELKEGILGKNAT